MVEVTITNALKEKQIQNLIRFLFNYSKEVCFTSFHDYYVDEDLAVELINEYKERCKEKHRQITQWYNNNDPFIMKALKKLHITTEYEFEEYKESIFEADMSFCRRIQPILDELEREKLQRDYNEEFKEIKDDFVSLETHMFDSVFVYHIPLDILAYKASENLMNVLLNMKSLSKAVLRSDNNIVLINPLFCNETEGFAVIHTENAMATIVLNEEQYKEFKKLKIRHKKVVVEDEKKQ